jgi:hypothetical protein
MMFKTFHTWMEERRYTRQVSHMLLRRLGLDKNALKKQTIKLGILEKEQLKRALESLPGLDDDKIAELQTWLDKAEEPTLQNLIAQIGDEVEVPDEGDELPGQPAQLPQGQPKPPPQQQPPQQQPPQQQPQMPPMV